MRHSRRASPLCPSQVVIPRQVQQDYAAIRSFSSTRGYLISLPAASCSGASLFHRFPHPTNHRAAIYSKWANSQRYASGQTRDEKRTNLTMLASETAKGSKTTAPVSRTVTKPSVSSTKGQPVRRKDSLARDTDSKSHLSYQQSRMRRKGKGAREEPRKEPVYADAVVEQVANLSTPKLARKPSTTKTKEHAVQDTHSSKLVKIGEPVEASVQSLRDIWLCSIGYERTLLDDIRSLLPPHAKLRV